MLQIIGLVFLGSFVAGLIMKCKEETAVFFVSLCAIVLFILALRLGIHFLIGCI